MLRVRLPPALPRVGHQGGVRPQCSLHDLTLQEELPVLPSRLRLCPGVQGHRPEVRLLEGEGTMRRRKRELQRVHDRVLQENLRALLRELEFPRRTEKLMHKTKKHTVLSFCVICVPYDLLCYCSYRSYKTYKLKLDSSSLQYEIYIYANQNSKIPIS